MSGVLLEGLRDGCALLLMGFVIKWMDDALDIEFDICRGKQTLAARFSRAITPYTLVLALLAVSLNLKLSIAVFLGSYAVGMLTTWHERLPTKLPSYVEIILSLCLSTLLVGWETALFGVALMAVFDWIDDLVDQVTDQQSGQRNVALRLGVVETTLLTLIALCIAVLTNAYWTALGLVAFSIVTMISEVTTKPLWQHTESEEEVEPQ